MCVCVCFFFLMFVCCPFEKSALLAVLLCPDSDPPKHTQQNKQGHKQTKPWLGLGWIMGDCFVVFCCAYCV